jgi:predicted lipid-binding transport protein (Tim44 family)
MTARRFLSLTPTLLCAALIAACASSASSTTGASKATTPTVTTSSGPTAKKPKTVSPPSPSSAPTTAASAAIVAQYEAICKAVIQREPTLAESVRSKVESICNKASAGNVAGARAAAREVCAEVIKASPLPAAAKEKALASCKSS